MTSKFASGFVTGMKEGPVLFFAPLLGAIKGICAESRRATRPHHQSSTPARPDTPRKPQN